MFLERQLQRPMMKKYVSAATYAVLIACILTFTYYTLREKDLFYWYWNEKYGMDMNAAIKLRNAEWWSYEKLIQYILHPQYLCRAPIILGGITLPGGQVDGDKVICLEPGRGISKNCIVYSFGIAYEWSFDEAIHAKFGCQVFAFDPSMDTADHMHSEGIWFYKIGIGETDETINKTEMQTWRMKTFDSIMEQLGHTNRTIDVLKMDIEGSEFEVLEDMLNKGAFKSVNHLCVEIHLLKNPNWEVVFKLLKRIEIEGGLRHFSTRNNTVVPFLKVPGTKERYEQHFFEMAWYRS